MLTDSLSRKLTLLLFLPFMIGWGFYLVGLISELNIDKSMLNQPSKPTPNFFPFYISLVGGPVLVKIGLLHAVLSGVVGSVFGTVSAILGAIYLPSIGAVTFTCLSATQTSEEDSISYYNGSSLTNIRLMLLGLILQGASWGTVFAFSSMYMYQLEPDKEHEHSSSPRHYPRVATCSPKVARLLSTLCLVVAMISWCVLCFGLYHMSEERESTLNYTSFHTSVAYFLIHFVALLNASSESKAMSIITSVLSVLYFYFLGDKMNTALRAQEECTEMYPCTDHEQYIHASKLVLVGGAVSLFLWGSSFALGPFYRKPHRPTNRFSRWIKSRPFSRTLAKSNHAYSQ